MRNRRPQCQDARETEVRAPAWNLREVEGSADYSGTCSRLGLPVQTGESPLPAATPTAPSPRASERSNRAVQRAAGGPNPWTRWRPEYSTFGPSDAPTRLFRAKRTCSPPSPRIRNCSIKQILPRKTNRPWQGGCLVLTLAACRSCDGTNPFGAFGWATSIAFPGRALAARPTRPDRSYDGPKFQSVLFSPWGSPEICADRAIRAFYPVLLPPRSTGGQREPRIRQPKICPISPIRAFLQRFLPVDSPRGRVQRALADRPAAETCQRSPLRQPRSDRQALGGIQAPVSAAAPLRSIPGLARALVDGTGQVFPTLPAGGPSHRPGIARRGRGSARAAGRAAYAPAGGSGRELRIRQPISCRNRR